MSSFSLSPNVEIREVDQTTFVPGVSSSIAAFSGAFSWGPVLEIQTIENEAELIEKFSKPTDQNYEYFFSVSTFLSYANNIKIVRCEQTGMINANSEGSTDVFIKNEDNYRNAGGVIGGSPEETGFVARFPGILGNSLKVSYCLACDATRFDSWEYKDYFNSEPDTSGYASARGAQYDEIHVIVIDEDGDISGFPGTILETFPFLSIASDAKSEDGRSIYFKNVLAEQSRYVFFLSNDSVLDLANAGSTTSSTVVYYNRDAGSPLVDPDVSYSLTQGADGALPTVAQRTAGYDLFKGTESIDANLIIGGPSPIVLDDAKSYCNYLIKNIAETRHDAIAFVSPMTSGPYSIIGQTDINNITTWLDELTSSSFGVADTNAIKIYDKYNDKYRWIPTNGSVAGTCAYTDNVSDTWWSPAGFNRGHIRNAIKVAYNPTKSDRDALYKKRGNPIVEFPGEGIVLYGDKTLLSRPSAFDRINVRRLFNVMEKAISTAARYMLFEFNDEFTRSQFVNMIEPYLRTVKGRRGIYDYRVVCNETNNTSDVIDRNEFVGDIYVKPARSINFVRLSFIATRTNVDFEEIVE